jgi:hypothetical protein
LASRENGKRELEASSPCKQETKSKADRAGSETWTWATVLVVGIGNSDEQGAHRKQPAQDKSGTRAGLLTIGTADSREQKQGTEAALTAERPAQDEQENTHTRKSPEDCEEETVSAAGWRQATEINQPNRKYQPTTEDQTEIRTTVD